MPTEARHVSETRERHRRATSLWRLAWSEAAVLALWALGRLAVPPLVKSQRDSRHRDRPGRPLSVGAGEFRPWTPEPTPRNVAVAARDGATTPQRPVARFALCDLRLRDGEDGAAWTPRVQLAPSAQ